MLVRQRKREKEQKERRKREERRNYGTRASENDNKNKDRQLLLILFPYRDHVASVSLTHKRCRVEKQEQRERHTQKDNHTEMGRVKAGERDMWKQKLTQGTHKAKCFVSVPPLVPFQSASGSSPSLSRCLTVTCMNVSLFVCVSFSPPAFESSTQVPHRRMDSSVSLGTFFCARLFSPPGRFSPLYSPYFLVPWVYVFSSRGDRP